MAAFIQGQRLLIFPLFNLMQRLFKGGVSYFSATFNRLNMLGERDNENSSRDIR